MKIEHLLKDKNELKARANNTIAEENALLGELKQRLNGTISTANNILPASKGEYYQQAKEIDQQNMIIDRLVMQINALTPVSGIA